MRIRTADVSDLPGILELLNWAIAETPANFKLEPIALPALREKWLGAHERYPWLVAGASERGIVGFASAYEYKPRSAYRFTAEVAVYVHPAHQRRGCGTALYAELIAALRSSAFHSLIASITIPNEASERLHATFGFRHVGTISEAGFKLDRWHDISLWQLRLQQAHERR